MATLNNGLSARSYEKKFAMLLQTVFGAQSAFQPAFGQLQALDGVQDKDIAFTVKTSDIPVTVGEYNTDANVGMGTGTAKSSRFGDIVEVKYTDQDVPYSWTWAIHEGLDRFTVNAELDAAVADRLNLQAQAKIRMFNNQLGKALATASTDLGAVDDVNTMFEKAVVAYTDMEMMAQARAYVTADVYNAIIDHNLVTSTKGSAVNIDDNGILRFRDIIVNKVPSSYMQGKAIIFTPDNIGRAFTGIVVTRAMDAYDFAGTEIQGAGKAGTFILDDNKKAILSATPKA